MFQLRPSATTVFDPVLIRDPLVLRAPQSRDFEAWATLRAESRSHLTKWEDDWQPKDVTPSAFRRRLRFWERQRRAAALLALFAFRLEDDALVGGATLSNIRFGASRSGVLGYWIGSRFLRRGYGRIMVNETVRHALDVIGLNRVEAACQPENTASARLLEQVGFQREGRARGYLRINGVWRDHDIFAVTAGDQPSQARE